MSELFGYLSHRGGDGRSADEPYEMPKLIGRSTGHGLYLLADDVTALSDV